MPNNTDVINMIITIMTLALGGWLGFTLIQINRALHKYLKKEQS